MNEPDLERYLRQVVKPFNIFGLTLRSHQQILDQKDQDAALILKDYLAGALFALYTILVMICKMIFLPIANVFDAVFMIESIMVTIRNVCMIFSFFAISRRLGALTRGIEIFDSKIPNISARSNPWRFGKWRLYQVFMLVAAIYVTFQVRESYLHNVHVNKVRYGMVAAIITDFPMSFYWNACPVVFLVLCLEFRSRFEDLQLILKDRLTSIVGRYRFMGDPKQSIELATSKSIVRRYQSMGNPEQSIEQVRLLHAELTSLADTFGSCFGLYLTCYFLFTFLKQLILFYRCLYVTKKFKLIRALIFLQIWVGAYLHSNFSEKLMTSSRKIMDELRNCPTTKLPTIHCQDQILLFMTQLQTSSLSITASELFTVDKQLLTSMIMAVTTYIIVIIQLTPDINSLLRRFDLNSTIH